MQSFEGKVVKTGRLPWLDGWRALAISGVLCAHFLTSVGINSGRLGVELFFVLSGRLMAQMLFVEPMGLRPFYYRRFSRVWPALIVFLVVATICAPLAGLKGPSGLQAVSVLTVTYNYLAVFGGSLPLFDHIWSLCVEEHTYVFLGLLSLCDRRAPRLTLPLLAITILLNFVDGAVSTLVFKQSYYSVFWRTDVRMSSILLGAAAYLASVRLGWRVTGPWPALLALLGVALNGHAAPDLMKYSLGTLCLALAVANLDRAEQATKRALSHPSMIAVGAYSYSLYLWQQPFSVVDATSRTGAIGLLLAAIACGVFGYFLIEAPARRWLNAHSPPWARLRRGADLASREPAAGPRDLSARRRLRVLPVEGHDFPVLDGER
jgi:peptidoglycan/LPS O-acetylase OafA/YrhL